jgi:hypothetical protein
VWKEPFASMKLVVFSLEKWVCLFMLKPRVKHPFNSRVFARSPERRLVAHSLSAVAASCALSSVPPVKSRRSSR